MPELSVPDTLSCDAVPEPLGQQCCQEMDDVSLRRGLENAKQETELATTEGQENQPAAKMDPSSPPSTQRLRNEQRKEIGDLKEYAGTKENIFVDDEGILRYSGHNELPAVVSASMRDEVFSWYMASGFAATAACDVPWLGCPWDTIEREWHDSLNRFLQLPSEYCVPRPKP